ncbi:MAG: hypothetical protein M5U31_11945 [Acidimicrobiia bacterium]|nr:hypothetical protein [Acidimicrobiia bacterium]
MRVPLSWLRDFAPIPGTPAEVAEALDDLGLVVDALEQPGAEVQGVITAKVLAVSDHPNADRLTLVDVDQGMPPHAWCAAPATSSRVTWFPTRQLERRSPAGSHSSAARSAARCRRGCSVPPPS